LNEPEKPETVVYPIQTGGDFKIHESRAPTPPVFPIAPPTKKSPMVEKKNIEVPPKVVMALKLADEESDVEKPIEATLEQTPLARVPAEESNVQVIEAPIVKMRKVKRVANERLHSWSRPLF
jgi:hypothetical protein